MNNAFKWLFLVNIKKTLVIFKIYRHFMETSVFLHSKLDIETIEQIVYVCVRVWFRLIIVPLDKSIQLIVDFMQFEQLF